jgi:hypothetical protein
MGYQEWQDLGDASLRAELMRGLIEPTNGAQFRNVHNNKTGQDFIVYIGPHQTLEQAIANQQFRRVEERDQKTRSIQAISPVPGSTAR